MTKCRDSYVIVCLYSVKVTAGPLREATVALGANKVALLKLHQPASALWKCAV